MVNNNIFIELVFFNKKKAPELLEITQINLIFGLLELYFIKYCLALYRNNFFGSRYNLKDF